MTHKLAQVSEREQILLNSRHANGNSCKPNLPGDRAITYKCGGRNREVDAVTRTYT